MNDSMSTAMDSVFSVPPIEQVREGMPVVDWKGRRLGTVEYVQMGDPQAITTEGNELAEPGLIGRLGMALVGDEREPDVPEPFRSKLLRRGFLKIDGPGLFDHDRYASSEQIAAITGDTVVLAADKQQLAEEA